MFKSQVTQPKPEYYYRLTTAELIHQIEEQRWPEHRLNAALFIAIPDTRDTNQFYCIPYQELGICDENSHRLADFTELINSVCAEINALPSPMKIECSHFQDFYGLAAVNVSRKLVCNCISDNYLLNREKELINLIQAVKAQTWQKKDITAALHILNNSAKYDFFFSYRMFGMNTSHFSLLIPKVQQLCEKINQLSSKLEFHSFPVENSARCGGIFSISDRLK